MADGNFFTDLFREQHHVNLYTILVIAFITLSSAAYGYAAANIATTLTQPSHLLIEFRSFLIQNSAPIWIAELAPPKVRGAIADAHALLMLFGYCIASLVGLGSYFHPDKNQWRGIVGIQMVFPTIILCGIYSMPESPRYLNSRDRTEEAWEIVKRLHAVRNEPGAHESVTREFYQMRKQIELDRRFQTSYWGTLTTPSLRKRAIMMIFLEFSIYSCGVLVILSPDFESSKFK